MWKRLLLPALALVVALVGARADGDYVEYFTLSRALATRGTPAIEASDLTWLNASLSLAPGTFQLTDRMFYVALDGHRYPVHFWLYSLLVAPFLGLFSLIHLAPALAFAVVNAISVTLAMLYVERLFGGHWRGFIAALLVLLSGATFYLGWTAPEALTGAAVLVACLAATRGDAPIGSLATGLAASQNPSAGALFLLVAVGWWRVRRASGKSLVPEGGRARAMVAAGVLLAAAPYCFFELKFHVPSLISVSAIDPSLIGWARLKSLIFDLDQGMIDGLPGLMLGVVVALVGVLGFGGRPERKVALVRIAALALAFALIVPPVLGQSNWNSAAVVVMRYAYWTAMPLLALALELLPLLSRRWAAATLCTIVAGQSVVFALNGVCGEKWRYVAHSPVGRFVLTHQPSFYNPLPEIFWERTNVQDRALSLDSRAYFPARDWPTKILTHWSNPLVPCSWFQQGQQIVVASSITQMEDGYTYLNGPFSCRSQEETPKSVWRTDLMHHDARILREGWSELERAGVWSDGARSKLRLEVANGVTPRFIRFHGRYYKKRGTVVLVGGERVGQLDLSDARLRLPSALPSGKAIDVELIHLEPRSPKDAGESKDERRLAYLLQVVGLEWED